MGAKYIFVTGGVVSSLGKGITAASLGRLLKNRGVGVFMQKFDPYINMDPGRMSPLQHGEVFVTDDGVEADLDLGHYERFIDVSLNTNSTVTSGKIYWSILNRELQNGFNGKTVQVIPHVTNAIKERVYASGNQEGVDVVITEIGGTVGDIESLPFLEAIRQISNEVGSKNCMFIHATLLPYLGKAGEIKTKPTQHSVKEMRSIGIQPDVIVCRTEIPVAEDIKKKIALFCNVPERNVVENIDADNLYEVPLLLEKEHLDDIVVDHLGLNCGKADMTQWEKMINNAKNSTKKVKVALVGQYVELHDAYLSISEALTHAGHVYNADVEIKWIQSDDVTADTVGELLGDVDGILVPPGEEKSGVDGNILAVKYARENNVPFLGITLGMHCAVVEFARNVLGLSGADSTQFNATPADAVIVKGSGTRKGAYPCKLTKGSMFEAIYGANDISERHRHAYEVNADYAEKLEAAGFKVAGICPDNSYIEALELEGHPFFVGVQFNSEYKSRPTKPHPLFLSFIKAIIKK